MPVFICAPTTMKQSVCQQWRELSSAFRSDCSISLGVLLAFGMSFYETVAHGPHAYFDAALMLITWKSSTWMWIDTVVAPNAVGPLRPYSGNSSANISVVPPKSSSA